MSFVIALLTFVLVLICILLIMLVLVQLPKKDAGAGMAFGGGTADALFGAGSGNALTKITKWVTGIFLAMCFFLGYLESGNSSDSGAAFTKQVENARSQMQPPAMAPAPAAHPTTAPQSSNLFVIPTAPAGSTTGK